MSKVIKIFILFLALDFITPSYVNAQIKVRFDRDCLFANSLEFGRAILESIGEKATRKLIERDEKIRIVVEIDSLGKVTKIIRCDFHFITNNPWEERSDEIDVTFKIRHTPDFTKGKIIYSPNGVHLLSAHKLQGIAPGQFGVIYDDTSTICIGSGEII